MLYIAKYTKGGVIDTDAMSDDLRSDVKFYKDGNFTAKGRTRLAAIEQISHNQERGYTYKVDKASNTFKIVDKDGKKVDDSEGRGIGSDEKAGALYGLVNRDKKAKREISRVISSASFNDKYFLDEAEAEVKNDNQQLPPAVVKDDKNPPPAAAEDTEKVEKDTEKDTEKVEKVVKKLKVTDVIGGRGNVLGEFFDGQWDYYQKEMTEDPSGGLAIDAAIKEYKDAAEAEEEAGDRANVRYWNKEVEKLEAIKSRISSGEFGDITSATTEKTPEVVAEVGEEVVEAPAEEAQGGLAPKYVNPALAVLSRANKNLQQKPTAKTGEGTGTTINEDGTKTKDNNDGTITTTYTDGTTKTELNLTQDLDLSKLSVGATEKLEETLKNISRIVHSGVARSADNAGNKEIVAEIDAELKRRSEGGEGDLNSKFNNVTDEELLESRNKSRSELNASYYEFLNNNYEDIYLYLAEEIKLAKDNLKSNFASDNERNIYIKALENHQDNFTKFDEKRKKNSSRKSSLSLADNYNRGPAELYGNTSVKTLKEDINTAEENLESNRRDYKRFEGFGASKTELATFVKNIADLEDTLIKLKKELLRRGDNDDYKDLDLLLSPYGRTSQENTTFKFDRETGKVISLGDWEAKQLNNPDSKINNQYAAFNPPFEVNYERDVDLNASNAVLKKLGEQITPSKPLTLAESKTEIIRKYFTPNKVMGKLFQTLNVNPLDKHFIIESDREYYNKQSKETYRDILNKVESATTLEELNNIKVPVWQSGSYPGGKGNNVLVEIKEILGKNKAYYKKGGKLVPKFQTGNRFSLEDITGQNQAFLAQLSALIGIDLTGGGERLRQTGLAARQQEYVNPETELDNDIESRYISEAQEDARRIEEAQRNNIENANKNSIQNLLAMNSAITGIDNSTNAGDQQYIKKTIEKIQDRTNSGKTKNLLKHEEKSAADHGCKEGEMWDEETETCVVIPPNDNKSGTQGFGLSRQGINTPAGTIQYNDIAQFALALKARNNELARIKPVLKNWVDTGSMNVIAARDIDHATRALRENQVAELDSGFRNSDVVMSLIDKQITSAQKAKLMDQIASDRGIYRRGEEDRVAKDTELARQQIVANEVGRGDVAYQNRLAARDIEVADATAEKKRTEDWYNNLGTIAGGIQERANTAAATRGTMEFNLIAQRDAAKRKSASDNRDAYIKQLGIFKYDKNEARVQKQYELDQLPDLSPEQREEKMASWEKLYNDQITEYTNEIKKYTDELELLDKVDIQSTLNQMDEVNKGTGLFKRKNKN
jgi:hypothetical protein